MFRAAFTHSFAELSPAFVPKLEYITRSCYSQRGGGHHLESSPFTAVFHIHWSLFHFSVSFHAI